MRSFVQKSYTCPAAFQRCVFHFSLFIRNQATLGTAVDGSDKTLYMTTFLHPPFLSALAAPLSYLFFSSPSLAHNLSSHLGVCNEELDFPLVGWDGIPLILNDSRTGRIRMRREG